MIPRAVRENACRGLTAAYAEAQPIHPDVRPIAQKLCGGLALTDDDRVKISMFHTQFASIEAHERRDELRYLQMGGFEAVAWAFPAAEPAPVPLADPDDVLARLEAATTTVVDTTVDVQAAEVTQPRLDRLTERLAAIDDRLRARIEGALAVTLRVAAGKVGVQLARAGTRKSLPADAKDLHAELGNTLEFLHQAKPEVAGLVRTWALAALDTTEEQLAIDELAKLPDEVLPALAEASEDIITAIAEELDLDRDAVAEQLAPVHEQHRQSVFEFLTAIGPALVLGRLTKASEGAQVRSTIPKGIVDDVLRVAGGADFTAAGGVPISEAGNRFRLGVEMEGDLFAQSDLTIDAIEVTDGTRPGYQKTFSHHDFRPGAGNRKKESNPLHRRQHGRVQAEAEVAPGQKRGCECTWETALQAAGFADFDPHESLVLIPSSRPHYSHVCPSQFEMADAGGMKKTLVRVEERIGYEVRVEVWDNGMTEPHEMTSAYSPDGGYIGTVDVAEFLVDERGIAPELRHPDSNVCSIGFCEAEQKWYGWSHRAIFGFGIGDTIKKGDVIAHRGVGRVAETLDDAKQFADWFADEVG